MPISGPSSYPPTIREFLEHWDAVNAFLGVGQEMILPGNIDVNSLNDWSSLLDTQRDAVTDAGVDRSLARGLLNARIDELRATVAAFNGRVRSDLQGTPYERALPAAFSAGAGEAVVRQTVRQVIQLWTRINAFTPTPSGITLPLVLQGGTTLAALTTAAADLPGLYTALSDAELDLKLERERREDLQDEIYPVLKAYRLKVPVTLPPGSALVDSLPVLTPPEGRTPDAVEVTAVWNAGTTLADVTWAASAEPDLKEYEVRAAPGEEYDADDEVVLTKVPAGDPRTLSTLFSLGTPGLTVGFKVYVVLNTGRERGSSPVYVTRPIVT